VTFGAHDLARHSLKVSSGESAMAENFLEEQLKRIRQLTEQMSQLRSHAAELSDEMIRNRAMTKRSPLHEVRDFRSYSSIDQTPDHAEDHVVRSTPRQAPRSRRR
jgi:hypothetical protein